MSIIDTRTCCVWYSRVNLTHRKITLKYKECGSGFCHDESRCMCWSHHLVLGGCPLAPKRGNHKKNAREDDEDNDDDG